MRLFQAALDTCLDSLLFCQPLSSRFALHGLHALEYNSVCIFESTFVREFVGQVSAVRVLFDFLNLSHSHTGSGVGGMALWNWQSLKFQRVTIRGAQPSARLSEEICLSEGSAGVSQRALRGSLRGFCGALRGSAGGPWDFPRFFGGSDPMLVTLGNRWSASDM